MNAVVTDMILPSNSISFPRFPHHSRNQDSNQTGGNNRHDLRRDPGEERLKEVKQRVLQAEEKAKYAILPKQQKRIVNAAKIYIKNHPNYQNCNIRFDAVLVKLPFQILHIKNAWNENIYS